MILLTRFRNGKRVYAKKIELCHEIEAIIRDGDASEESLSKEHKNALDSFQKQKSTNIIDLVDDVLRSPRSLENVTPQHSQFLAAFADANIPETVIKNKTALKRFRVIKADDVNDDSSDDATVSSTTSSVSCLVDNIISFQKWLQRKHEDQTNQKR